MTPLSDRAVVVALIATVGVVFALIFWTARLAPSPEAPLQWRDRAPEARRLLPGTGGRSTASPAAATAPVV
ncbi:MAG: hypothetical protein ACKO6F_11630 [Cyanobium sp.]